MESNNVRGNNFPNMVNYQVPNHQLYGNTNSPTIVSPTVFASTSQSPVVAVVDTPLPRKKPKVSGPRWIRPYSMSMSSRHSQCGNSIENLDENVELAGFTGVGTDEMVNPFVEVEFFSVGVFSKMEIGPCLQGGWGSLYLDGCLLEFSEGEGHQWVFLSKLSIAKDASSVMVNLKKTRAKRFRIRLEGKGYVGIGIWKFYGELEQEDDNLVREETLADDVTRQFHSVLSLPYNLVMSSKYSTCENLYQDAINEDDLTRGLGTDTELNAFVQASFDKVYHFSHVKIAPLSKKGWGEKYLNGTVLEYSENGLDWNIHCSLKGFEKKPNIITLDKSAAFWRVRREDGYVAMGLFKFYVLTSHYTTSHVRDIPTIEPFVIPFTLDMSSEYEQCANSFEALQDENGLDGAGTEKEAGYISAVFDDIYELKMIKIKPIRDPAWGQKYLENAIVECALTEDGEYETITTLKVTEEMKLIVPGRAKKARCVCISLETEGYLGIGTLKFYGTRINK